jgi:1-acyl-sn-glycerol-3-phosphate acyltransferase
MALSYLGQGEILGIFPEGTRSKTGEMLAFLNGAAYFAVKSGATIVPVAITGHYRLFQRMEVRIGDPIHVTDYGQGKTGSEHLNELSKVMMEQIAHLRDGD